MVITDEHGQYRIDGLAGVVNVRFEKRGYESGRSGALLDRDQVVNGVIQRAIQLAPGESTEITVFRDDDAMTSVRLVPRSVQEDSGDRSRRFSNFHSRSSKGREQARLPSG